jgi:hypothetical protein
MEETHWSAGPIDALRDAVEASDFQLALGIAMRAALTAGPRLRSSRDIRELHHEAFFYTIAAAAAYRIRDSERFLDAYFMGRRAMDRFRQKLGISSEACPETPEEIDAHLDQLGKAVSRLGIDPSQDPMVWFKMRMAMNPVPDDFVLEDFS